MDTAVVADAATGCGRALDLGAIIMTNPDLEIVVPTREGELTFGRADLERWAAGEMAGVPLSTSGVLGLVRALADALLGCDNETQTLRQSLRSACKAYGEPLVLDRQVIRQGREAVEAVMRGRPAAKVPLQATQMLLGSARRNCLAYSAQMPPEGQPDWRGGCLTLRIHEAPTQGGLRVRWQAWLPGEPARWEFAGAAPLPVSAVGEYRFVMAPGWPSALAFDDTVQQHVKWPLSKTWRAVVEHVGGAVATYDLEFTGYE